MQRSKRVVRHGDLPRAPWLNLFGMTSLYILPLWTATGRLVELIYRELMDPRVRQTIESELAEAKLPPPG